MAHAGAESQGGMSLRREEVCEKKHHGLAARALAGRASRRDASVACGELKRVVSRFTAGFKRIRQWGRVAQRVGGTGVLPASVLFLHMAKLLEMALKMVMAEPPIGAASACQRTIRTRDAAS